MLQTRCANFTNRLVRTARLKKLIIFILFWIVLQLENEEYIDVFQSPAKIILID